MASKLPDYLQNHQIQVCEPRVSSTDNNLPLLPMPPLDFEKFCCEYLTLKYQRNEFADVYEILPITSHGKKQSGADIFIKQKIASGNVYSLFEVKRITEFTKTHFKDAINRFKKHYHDWDFKISKFTIIVASPHIS